MKGTPILLLLLVGLCCLSSLGFAKHDRLFVSEGLDEATMYKLIKAGFDVRGIFDGHGFIFSPDNLSLKSYLPDAVSLGSPQAISYIVIQEEAPSLGWRSMIQQLNSYQPDIIVLLDVPSLVLIGVYDKSLLDISKFLRLPREAEYISLPESSILLPKAVPEKIIKKKLENLTFRQSIEELISEINEQDLRTFLEHLTGESGSNFITRHSTSNDAVRSGDYAISVFEEYGFNATSESFRAGYCPNIIAELKGTLYPDEVIIVGAHLDCRNRDISDATTRAPGANDDGSGSSAILGLARAIGTSNVKFARTLRLGLWCGEEQGLLGSRAYAKESSNNDENIVAMFQADMIGYQAYASPQCAFVSLYTNAALTTFTKEIATLYVPEITRVDTTACCSDHQSFYEVGYPSVGLVEGGGYTIDPKYHNVDDTANRSGFNFNQIQSIARILLASAADLAEIS